MARMLQALKNLEARSPRPSEPVAPAKAPQTAQKQKPSPAKATVATPSPAVADATQDAQGKAASLIRPSRRPVASPLVVPPAKTASEKAASSTAGSAPVSTRSRVVTKGLTNSRSSQVPHPTPLPKEDGTIDCAPSAPTRPATSFERLISRTLSASADARQLRELGERLCRDLEQTGNRTLLLVGVGESSNAREAIIYVARMLAEKLSGRVLVVDADLARKPLSSALEYAQEPGLAELVCGEELRSTHYRLTATANLLFLAAGRHPDVELSAARCEQVVRQLSEDFACVLIDGGRTSDAAAASLARVADATYFVVQLGAVEKNAAQAALRDFRAAGARVLGAIAT